MSTPQSPYGRQQPVGGTPGYGQQPPAPTPGYGQQPPAPTPGYGQQPSPGYSRPVASPGYGGVPTAQPQPSAGYGRTTAPAAAASGAPVSTRRKSVLPAVLLTFILTAATSVGGTLFATGQVSKTPVFDAEAVAVGVAEVLFTDFQLTDVDESEVSCPSDIAVEQGTEFECTFTSGGKDLSVPILVLNDKGQFRVGGPDSDSEK